MTKVPIDAKKYFFSHSPVQFQFCNTSLTNVSKMEGSRSRLLEKSFSTVYMYALSCMAFSHVNCYCLDVRCIY